MVGMREDTEEKQVSCTWGIEDMLCREYTLGNTE